MEVLERPLMNGRRCSWDWMDTEGDIICSTVVLVTSFNPRNVLKPNVCSHIYFIITKLMMFLNSRP